MKKRIGVMFSVLALCGGTAFAQSQMDAYRYAQTELNGTARHMAMGGAFGALGGDISVMNTNPAGLAVYRSSEVVTTLSLSSTNAKTDWLGTALDQTKTKVNFDNIAYVGYFPTANDEGIVSWNVGFSYNRLKNYQRSYTMAAGGSVHTSLSDYVAMRAYGTSSDRLADANAYSNPDVGDWLSVVGYQAGYVDAYRDDNKRYYSAFGDNDQQGTWTPYSLSSAQMRVTERGAIDQYDISFGMNISDIVLLGATVAVTDLNYRLTSLYDEAFTNENKLYLDNYFATDGTGYSFNVGAIVRPTDFLRLGVAYNSPIWYKMSDAYYAEAGSYLTFMQDGKLKERSLDAKTPSDAFTDYQFRSPDKWIFSAAAILGQIGLISVDYEMTNYQNMRMRDDYGNENEFTNYCINEDFKMGNTVRVGAEVKVTPQFAVRAGVAYSDSPVKDPLKNGQVEVRTVGTIPFYTVDKGVTHYSVGLGYRFTPNFYLDLACVYRTYKEDVYSFSNMFDENGQALVVAQPASLKTNTTKVALTLGYKF